LMTQPANKEDILKGFYKGLVGLTITASTFM